MHLSCYGRLHWNVLVEIFSSKTIHKLPDQIRTFPNPDLSVRTMKWSKHDSQSRKSSILIPSLPPACCMNLSRSHLLVNRAVWMSWSLKTFPILKPPWLWGLALVSWSKLDTNHSRLGMSAWAMFIRAARSSKTENLPGMEVVCCKESPVFDSVLYS